MQLRRPEQLPVLSQSLKELLASIAPQCPIANLIAHALKRVHYYGSTHPRHAFYSRAPYYSGGQCLPLAIFNPEPVGNHFSFREKANMISYMPAGRTQGVNVDGRWERAGRVEMKPAKFLRALIHPRLAKRFKDHQFAAFSEKFRAHEASLTVSFEFVDFETGYAADNHKDGSPANDDSCMRNKPVGNFYEAYGAKCLVAKAASGIYLGRAIVWENVRGLTPTHDATFMDRVYAESPEVAELFFQHAASNGWYRKTRQSTGTETNFTAPDGGTFHNHNVTVALSTSLRDVSYFPYCDTFQYMDPNDSTLKNEGDEDDNTLDNTNGELTEAERGILCADGVHRPEDECVQVDSDWYGLDSDDIVCCADGEYRMRDDCFLCSRSDEYYPNSEGYTVQISRNETITIHEDYVDRI